MLRPLGLLAAIVALAGLAGWPAADSARAGAADEAPQLADGALPEGVEVGDGPELDEDSLEDLVADAQRILTLRGYDAGPIDGQFGLRTQRAIRTYQDAARNLGYLEALKGPPVAAQGSAADRRRALVRAEEPAPSQ